MEAETPRARPSLKLHSNSVGRGVAASHESIRESNLALVAAGLLRSGGGQSRADLADATGLTKATVSRLVKELIELGFAVEGETTPSNTAGRPATPLHLAEGSLVGVGVEINTDRIDGAAVDVSGSVARGFQLRGDFSVLPAAETLKLGATATAELLEGLDRGGARVLGVCLSVPGLIDGQARRVVYAPNLLWHDVDPGQAFSKVLKDVPWFLDNDANSQATATSAGGLPSSFLYLTGDTGIGGALVRDGRVVRGPRGFAGEIGHTTIEPDGPLCHCGSRGCLERYAGKRAILEAAGLAADAPPGALLELLNTEDPKAIAAAKRAGWALGIALSNAVNLLDVESVVLGTSLAPLLPLLEPEARKQLKMRVIGERGKSVELLPAPIRELPASVGGALHALEKGLQDLL